MLRFSCPRLSALALLTLLPLASPAQEKKLLPQEEAVKAFILDNANDPKSVELAKWGPHDLKAEVGLRPKHWLFFYYRGGSLKGDERTKRLLKALNYALERLRTEAEAMPGQATPVVRVRFRLANEMGGRELHDALFLVTGKMVLPLGDNNLGDNWQGTWKKLAPKLSAD
jgi:hypothetical protein